jgi:hypothetical protein
MCIHIAATSLFFTGGFMKVPLYLVFLEVHNVLDKLYEVEKGEFLVVDPLKIHNSLLAHAVDNIIIDSLHHHKDFNGVLTHAFTADHEFSRSQGSGLCVCVGVCMCVYLSI